MKIFLFCILLLPPALIAQPEMEKNMNIAYQNAIKGIYWALSNIPEKKLRLSNDLIAEEKLYASVKLVKEFEGIKITSKGIFNSTEVSIIIYRSNDGLLKDGYIKIEEKDKTGENN